MISKLDGAIELHVWDVFIDVETQDVWTLAAIYGDEQEVVLERPALNHASARRMSVDTFSRMFAIHPITPLLHEPLLDRMLRENRERLTAELGAPPPYRVGFAELLTIPPPRFTPSGNF